jgi:hypothetical protein
MNLFKNRMLSALIVAGGLVLSLGGCTYVQTVPGGAYAPYPPSPFEQTWAAALGALGDEGVQIMSANRDTGTIRGMRGAINVTAIVQTRADGGVQVEFKTSGNTDADPTLNQRIANDYNRRMGR